MSISQQAHMIRELDLMEEDLVGIQAVLLKWQNRARKDGNLDALINATGHVTDAADELSAIIAEMYNKENGI